MARALRWIVPFTTLNGSSCVVNIYAEGWTGGSTALVKESGIACPAADPFYYEEKKDKDLLTTLRYSTGYLRLVELFQSTHPHRVRLGLADEIDFDTIVSIHAPT